MIELNILNCIQGLIFYHTNVGNHNRSPGCYKLKTQHSTWVIIIFRKDYIKNCFVQVPGI